MPHTLQILSLLLFGLAPTLALAGVADAELDGRPSDLAALLVDQAVLECPISRPIEVVVQPGGDPPATGDACLDTALAGLMDLKPAPERIVARLTPQPGAPERGDVRPALPRGTVAEELDAIDRAASEAAPEHRLWIFAQGLQHLAMDCTPGHDTVSLFTTEGCPAPCVGWQLASLRLPTSPDAALDQEIGVGCSSHWLPADQARAVGWRVAVASTMRVRAVEARIAREGGSAKARDAAVARVHALARAWLEGGGDLLRRFTSRWGGASTRLSILVTSGSLGMRGTLLLRVASHVSPPVGDRCMELLTAQMTAPPEIQARFLRAPRIGEECPNPCTRDPWPEASGEELRSAVLAMCHADKPDPMLSPEHQSALSVDWIAMLRGATHTVQRWAVVEDSDEARRVLGALHELGPWLVVDPSLQRAPVPGSDLP